MIENVMMDQWEKDLCIIPDAGCITVQAQADSQYLDGKDRCHAV